MSEIKSGEGQQSDQNQEEPNLVCVLAELVLVSHVIGQEASRHEEKV